VNDVPVAEHEGGHTPFMADITFALSGSRRQRITVWAEDDPQDLEKTARQTGLAAASALHLVSPNHGICSRYGWMNRAAHVDRKSSMDAIGRALGDRFSAFIAEPPPTICGSASDFDAARVCSPMTATASSPARCTGA
jgi:hypothetical protein